MIEGTEGSNFIVGTPGSDLIDSKGGDDGIMEILLRVKFLEMIRYWVETGMTN